MERKHAKEWQAGIELLSVEEPHEVIAYWWHLVRLSDNEFQPDSIRAIRTEY